MFSSTHPKAFIFSNHLDVIAWKRKMNKKKTQHAKKGPKLGKYPEAPVAEFAPLKPSQTQKEP